MHSKIISSFAFSSVSFLLVLLAAVPAVTTEEGENDKTRGLVKNTGGTSPGYTLISPFRSGTAYLIDLEGRVVHKWESKYEPGLSPYLLPDGNLLRGIQAELDTQFGAGGIAGGFQQFTWDGKLVWELQLASELYYHHHDIEPLPNGNFLAVAWESKTRDEALARGRRPSHAGEKGLWPEVIVEIEPLQPIGARVVWEWRVWDHLIQATDSGLPGFGVVEDHPERVDINGDIPREEEEESQDQGASDEERAQLIALGYLSEDDAAKGDDGNGDGKKKDKDDAAKKRDRERSDWLHVNGIDYNEKLDQIVLSSWHMSEIWIIDHSTSTLEARGSTGGRSGRGGDLLYRWGNPQNCKRGTAADRKLFHQHDPQWIPEGHPGHGNITIFNNGRKRPEAEFSTVLEIVPPLLPDGTYALDGANPFGPEAPAWEYDPPEDGRFYASFISGAHRLQNGNTLICSGPDGRVMEVTREGQVVWEYKNPFAKPPEEGKLKDENYAMFRATRIPPDHPGLRGKELTPLEPQPETAVELLAKRGEKTGSTGWRSLIDESAQNLWVDGTCAFGVTFNPQPDPDDDGEFMIVSSGEPSGFERLDLVLENFIFELEWKHEDESGDAGLLVWADALPAVGEPFPRGLRISMANLGEGDDFTSQGDIFPILGATMTPDPKFRVSGSRSMPKEGDAHVKPGEWNRYRVTAIDGAVSLEVNDKVISGGSHCTPKKGNICLLSDGGKVHFRKIRLWNLPSGTHAADEACTARGTETGKPLFNGANLDGWKVLTGDWKVEKGLLTCPSDAGEIEVPLPNEAEHLVIDFRCPEGPRDHLPLRVGEARFEARGAIPGKWHRAHVTLGPTEVTLECGGEHQVVPRKNGEKPLVLTAEGQRIEFRNVFVDGS